MLLPHSPPSRWRRLVGALVALGLVAAPRPVSGQELRLTSPDRALLEAGPCDPSSWEPEVGVLFGLISDAGTDTPLPGSRANVSWSAAEAEGDPEPGGEPLRVESDGEGRYWFCGVPTGVELTLWAHALGRDGRTHTVRLSAGARRHDLRIPFTPRTGAVSGQLIDSETDEPIDGATVRIDRLDAGSLTDSRGHFQLGGLPSGQQELRIHHVAYGEQPVSVTVSADRTAFLEIRLAPRPIAMEPIAVEVEVRPQWLEQTGFYQRRAKGLGQFLSPEDLAKKHLRQMEQILENVQGIQLRRICRPHCFYYVETPTTTARCIPQFYIDGRKAWTPKVADLDALVSSVHDVAAVEVYRGISQTPAQYYGRCGSIVIWTKRAG